ncbi:MAG: helix-turn-helix domain-containing protein [Verrucomicrobia bacterium]|nr:helix-turn-helix domain-containing protein [Verrucomicrobiota bacterium]
MNTPIPDPNTPAAMPAINPKLLAAALGNHARWKILLALSTGEARMVSELAVAAGCTRDAASKHLAVLRRAGAVVQGRGRLYQIPPHHLPTPGEPIVDFGHCLLRLHNAG